MKSDVISFILNSENKKKIMRTIFEHPKRQWSCYALEDLTKISHATVFRTLAGLKEFGMLKSFKINKKDIVYELPKNPITKEIEKILDIGRLASKKIAKDFSRKIKSGKIFSIILYGSSVKGKIELESDIDILIVLNKHDKVFERELLNKAAGYSSEVNRSISLVIMDRLEVKKEKNSQFLKNIKEAMEILYGKEPL